MHVKFEMTWKLRIYQKLGKVWFALGTMKFWAHCQFCAYRRILGLRKGLEYLYRLFDFLRKQAKCGMKALQVPQSFHDKQGVKFMKKK